MQLTTSQRAALKAFCEGDATLNGLRLEGNYDGILTALAQLATPAFTVYPTAVHEHQITREVSGEGTSWSWPAYIARSQGERDGWARMFNGDFTINPSLPNVRQAFADIFSGSGNNAPAQRTHLAAVCKRAATVLEKLFATGAGSLASPATLGVDAQGAYIEGPIDLLQLVNLWR